LAPYFWQVYESTHESAELDENDFGKLKERPKRPHQHATRRQS
jgi:hypothetical protein